MSKRVMGILMVLIMVFMLVGGHVALASSGSVYISSHTANGDDPIREDRDFPLDLTITNKSGGLITNVRVSFGVNASFQPSGSGRDQPFSDSIPDNGSEDNDDTYTLYYTGGSDKNLPITITYINSEGEPDSVNTSIYIRNAQPEEEKEPVTKTPTDTTKYKPLLDIDSSDIPEGRAGGSINIPLTLTNNSSYEARDIRITPVFSDDTPFEIEQMTLYETVDRLRANNSTKINFQLKVDKLADKKTYILPLKIEYINAYKNSFEDEKLIYINITEAHIRPHLVVRNASSSPAIIEEGEDFTATFDVWNMGTLEAENVTIDLEPNEHFFVLDHMTKQYLYEMKGVQNKEITYNLRPKKDLETGTYSITILMQHKELPNPEKFTMYVSYQGDDEEEEEEDNVNVITENVITPQAAVRTEHPFTLSMDLINTGSTRAENVKISVDPGEMILPKSLNVIVIPEIEAGDSVPVAFSFIPGKECESRSYPIKAVIEYSNGDEMVKKEQYMGVLIESEEKESTLNTVPKIIISEYSSDPGMVNAGENFTLRMSFLNTSKLKAVENMKITLIVNESSEETGSVFTPVQSSNTFYIDYLAPGQTSEKEMVMYTIPDAKAKTYVVKAAFEYEYEEQDQLKTNSMEDVFGIPVVQPAKLETTEVIVSEPAFVGEPVYITTEFYNMGKVALSNLMIRIEGDFDAKETNYFVGNFQTGYSDYYEASIVPTQPGELNGMVVYTFEDAAGEAHRIESEFTVNAMEAMPVMGDFPGGEMGMDMGQDMGGHPGMMGPQPSKFPLIPIIIGGVVVVLVIVLIIVLRKRKKKKEMIFDEDI